MSTSWRTARLGQVVNIAIGRTPPRAESSCWDPGRTTGNVWLSIADLTAMTGRVIDDSKEYISNRAAADCRLVPQGTLLMSFKLSIGKLAFAGVPLYTNEAIAALTVIDPSRLDSEYLYHFLSAVDWKKYAAGNEKVKGATLNKEKLAAVEITVPPLAEQKRIVAKLDGLLGDVGRLEESLLVAGATADSLFLAGLEQEFELLRSCPDASFSEVAELSLGKMLDKKKATGLHPTPYLRNVNVRWGEFDLSDLAEMDIRPEEMSRVTVRTGDVVVCEGGEPGRCAVWRDDAPIAIQKALHRVRPRDGMLPDFIALSLEYQVKCGNASDHFSGTTIKHLTGEKLRALRVPVPNVSEQVEVVERLQALREDCNQLGHLHRRRVETNKQLRQSVLEAAFRGEL